MKALDRLALMIEMVSDIVMDGDGVTTSKGTGDHELKSQAAWHFGFYSRPKDSARGVVVKADGQGNTSFLFCFRDKQYELALEKGECGMKNAFDASVLLDKDGNITSVPGGSGKVLLGGASGTEPAVLGNALQTRLADLEAKFTAHVHPFTYAAGPSTGTAGTTVVTTSTLPHSGDVIKSTKAEVAP